MRLSYYNQRDYRIHQLQDAMMYPLDIFLAVLNPWNPSYALRRQTGRVTLRLISGV